jgi:hypothetical protein
MTARQHTVPRTYLRGFADPKGRLRAFDRVAQKALPVSLMDATVVKHIYDLHPGADGPDSQAVENYLAQKESAIAGPLEEIRCGRAGVEPAHREPLVEFLALQMTRTSRVWEEVHQLGDWYGKVWFDGITRQGVKERYREVGIEPTEEQIEEVIEFANNLDRYRFVPPKGSFLFMFLTAYAAIRPYLADGWNWLAVRSSRPFLTSDHPVAMIGHSADGALGVANAEEIWLPVGRHHAVVLAKDHSLAPVLLDIPAVHAKRVCQRIALESTRWLFWHPKDDALDGIATPPPGPRLKIENVGSRERGDGTVGELVRFRPNRPLIAGECLLGGRLIVNYRGALAPPWKPGRPRFPTGGS